MYNLFMNCPACNNKTFYNLKDGRKKCKKCGARFSIKKIEIKQKLIECFCDDLSAYECSKRLSISYVKAKVFYDKTRKEIALFLERSFDQERVLEYDEYIYLEKSKRGDKRNIFDAFSFLTFEYDDKVYNVLLEDLSKFKTQFLLDGAEDAYYKEFSKNMMFNKISKLQKKDNLIVKFWDFFESSITKYKGIKRENFFYYLKECEFKFNYLKKEQIRIINKLPQ